MAVGGCSHLLGQDKLSPTQPGRSRAEVSRSREILFPRQLNFGSHCVTILIIQLGKSRVRSKYCSPLGPAGHSQKSISREFSSLCRLFIVLLWFLCLNTHRELYLVLSNISYLKCASERNFRQTVFVWMSNVQL